MIYCFESCAVIIWSGSREAYLHLSLSANERFRSRAMLFHHESKDLLTRGHAQGPRLCRHCIVRSANNCHLCLAQCCLWCSAHAGLDVPAHHYLYRRITTSRPLKVNFRLFEDALWFYYLCKASLLTATKDALAAST